MLLETIDRFEVELASEIAPAPARRIDEGAARVRGFKGDYELSSAARTRRISLTGPRLKVSL